jgi:hypothetical protein
MRLRQSTSPAGTWDRDRDALTAREVATGLGLRPCEWWTFESDRPDLAESPGLDVYVHLDALRHGGPAQESDRLDRARERLAYLDRSGELTTQERTAIATGRGSAYQWRRAVLGIPEPVQELPSDGPDGTQSRVAPGSGGFKDPDSIPLNHASQH